MTRFALVATALVASLLSFSSGVNALCYACPNCNDGGCLYSWKCSGDTITCNYSTASDGSNSIGCEYTGAEAAGGYYVFTLTSTSPSACDGYNIGDNRGCEPYNDPWNAVSNECTAASAYVGEPGS
ncbi:hypothetical protein BU15DRAFT_64789 [Melanogaster broomeanus]|nr:hypothetical protein BU15DRAFT_64789 [Melanogaster broomeanus]